ncbi:MAG TPA: response regulator [Bryobacteraceae bacterium]|nr:response regulator [Bryobacteraceae bacterium]
MTRNVLIVEDVEVCRDALEAALTNGPNWKVCSVASGEEALKWLSENEASVLVTDLQLPSMDGLALIEAVRARTGSLPIVVISGNTDPKLPKQVAGLGANAFFAKPYSPAAVLNKVEELITRPRVDGKAPG